MCRESNYFYYSKTLEGEQYRVSCRRRVPPGTGPPTGPAHTRAAQLRWGAQQTHVERRAAWTCKTLGSFLIGGQRHNLWSPGQGGKARFAAAAGVRIDCPRPSIVPVP